MSPSLAAVEQQSLRGFLAMVERDFPEELIRIREQVCTALEMTSLVFELERAGKNPVVVYENVAGHDMPVVTNVAGNRKLLAACLGVSAEQLPSAFRERCRSLCISRATPRPTSPPARSSRATLSPALIPPASTA
jgi:2,5-furandicarboxylate decarboxylase 1